MSGYKERPKNHFQKAKAAQANGQNTPIPNIPTVNKPISTTILDKMVDGKEFASLLSYQFSGVNIIAEIQKSISEIESIRKRPLVCYVSNIVNPRGVGGTSINDGDDLPFNEMISSIPAEIKEIDVVLVTPGGDAGQVSKFVNRLRPRFDNVCFIILNKAMSAGTIFALSGDEIIMSNQSQIGPIDPQVPRANGRYLAAQGLLTLIDEINTRGEEALKQGKSPAWTDQLLLKNMDPMEIGAAMMASKYSIDMVVEYLYSYKFREWTTHSTTNPGTPVSDEDKKVRALRIAQLLCNHDKWKNHGHAITREAAWEVCQLKITHSETIEGLDKAMRRMWALFYWIFEVLPIAKIYTSTNYNLFRNFKPAPDSK
ncbi:SDH family Clp fold serine proteinase [Flavobacterium mekongense]|uniref:SDH family Clp fold serine proteinase n=1 Tax=Flavobacterium mekongense TaxID=3379707 RepID=UPI00399AB58D